MLAFNFSTWKQLSYPLPYINKAKHQNRQENLTHCCKGENFPVTAFKTSWLATPPTVAARGGRNPWAVLESHFTMSSFTWGWKIIHNKYNFTKFLPEIKIKNFLCLWDSAISQARTCTFYPQNRNGTVNCDSKVPLLEMTVLQVCIPIQLSVALNIIQLFWQWSQQMWFSYRERDTEVAKAL